MKRIAIFVLSAALILALSACGGGNETSGSDGETSAGSGSSGDNTLVVYYSVTGNTESAANYIAEDTGGDVFELEPEEPYTDEDLDWTNDNSRVVREHDDPHEQYVELAEDTVDNWEQYDTIFIGYPIWWEIAAWPVNDFVQSNDFTDKTVIPFCTSSSSGIGESGDFLAEMAGTGNWQEGQRFSSGVSQEEVRAWLEEIGF